MWAKDLADLSILSELPNLEIASFAQNKITSLKYFAYCHKLTELYVRKNQVSDITEINYLKNL